jgi:hypothetical protein
MIFKKGIAVHSESRQDAAGKEGLQAHPSIDWPSG